ncbi:MAG: ATPase, partial [Methylococcaceae bacterium]|nr:ATPase [Methylococcaceae bacterium]
MAIVSLKKITLCGLIADKTRVLDKLQSLGGTHLIPLAGKVKKSDNVPVHNIEDALSALKYLQQCPKKRHQVTQSKGFEFAAVVQEVVHLKNHLLDLLDQREFLQQRIKEVALWGDFALATDGQLQGYKLWFYIVPKRLMKVVHQSNLVWEIVNQTNTDAYVVVIAKDEPASKDMPVPRTHVGSLSLSQLHKDLDDTELAIEDAYAKREYLTRWMSLIMFNLAAYENQSDLDNAHLLTRDEPDVFVVQSWVPAEDIPRIENFSQYHRLAMLIEEPDGVEQPPTLLKNTTTFAGGEEVVKFYQTPNYYSWDPSVVVFFSFALFFSMILSDAGYAAIFLSFLLLKWQKMGRSQKGLRFRTLILVTVSVSCIWGVLV